MALCDLKYFDLKWKIKDKKITKRAIFSQNITKSITKVPLKIGFKGVLKGV
ncbi:hypothetical protein [uncultured Helicobacter sp.]|uniref:hypothetical protein n=1 Tax=uncultured Helicobacter sp. TaxID=175537 RepID=UPI00260F2AF2|nr:hypothetical protein [uncultured Helicobacter sp.]